MRKYQCNACGIHICTAECQGGTGVPFKCTGVVDGYCKPQWKEIADPRKLTNGDQGRQGGNRALAEFQQLNTCDNCIYNNDSLLHNYCDKLIDKTCTDGIEARLNAPADAPDTNVGTKESEGENEP